MTHSCDNDPTSHQYVSFFGKNLWVVPTWMNLVNPKVTSEDWLSKNLHSIRVSSPHFTVRSEHCRRTHILSSSSLMTIAASRHSSTVGILTLDGQFDFMGVPA
jgi:hypothetical protein